MKLSFVGLVLVLEACSSAPPLRNLPPRRAPVAELRDRLGLGPKATVLRGAQRGTWLMARGKRLLRVSSLPGEAPCKQVKHGAGEVWWLFPGARATALQLGSKSASLWLLNKAKRCVSPLAPPAGPALGPALMSLSAENDELAEDRVTLPGLPGKARVILGSRGFEITPSSEESSGMSAGEVPDPPHKGGVKRDDPADSDEDEDRYEGELELQAIAGKPAVFLITWTQTLKEGGSKGNESLKTTVTARLWRPREGSTTELYERSSNTNTSGGGGGTCSATGSVDSQATLLPWRDGWLVHLLRSTRDSTPDEPKEGDEGLCTTWLHTRSVKSTWRYVGLDGSSIDLAESEQTSRHRDAS